MSGAVKDLKESLVEAIADLSEQQLTQVIDFAEYLREKERRKQAAAPSKSKRIAGLHQGQGWISDDFNDELGDEFWFGEDFGITKKDDESAA